jgi:hypothetical protein
MRPGPGRKTGPGCVAGKQIPRPNRFLSKDSYTTISLSTKKIKGLHENDFIMASKINRVLDRSGRPLDRQ